MSFNKETSTVTPVTLSMPVTTLSDITPISPPAVDGKVSWVYQLRKDDLDTELKKFCLDVTGTVEEKRKRFIKFLREGLPSPRKLISPPFNDSTLPVLEKLSVLPPTTVTAAPCIITTANSLPTTVITYSSPPFTCTTAVNNPVISSHFGVMCSSSSGLYQTVNRTAPETNQSVNAGFSHSPPLKMYRWNLMFSGREDPAAFLEQVEERIAAENVCPDRVLQQMPELLQGEAALWFRNNKIWWRTWQEFVNDFKTFYFPVNYQIDLEAAISRRLQRPHEPVSAYITEMQTLMRRHGHMTSEQQLAWLFRNLLPEYRLQLRLYQFNDVFSFAKAARELELLNKEINENKQRSQPKRPDNHFVATREQLEPINTMATPPRQLPVSFRDRSQPSPRENTPVTTNLTTTNRPTPSTSNVNVSQPLCWRCGEIGHFRNQCKGRSKLFCSRCLKENVLTKDCSCNKPGNANRAGR